MSHTPMSVVLQDMVAEPLKGQPILRVRFQELLQAFESATEDLTAFILGDLGVPLHTLLVGIQPPQPAVKLPRLQLVPPEQDA